MRVGRVRVGRVRVGVRSEGGSEGGDYQRGAAYLPVS